jgi:hypothetical protein
MRDERANAAALRDLVEAAYAIEQPAARGS